MKLYVKCTTDEYELPLVVEDSPTKLAKKLGLKVSSVTSMVSKQRSGFYSMEVDDENEQVC